MTSGRDHPSQLRLPLVGSMARQLALPLDDGVVDGDLIETAVNRDAIRLLEDVDRWPSRAVLVAGPRKSGRSLHARLGAQRTGADIIEAADGWSEVALFDRLNEADRTASPLILVVDHAQPTWTVHLPDLASRLTGCGVARLRDPDDAMAEALLGKLLWRRGICSEPDMRRWALTLLERTHVAIWRFAEALDGGRPLTRGAVRRQVSAFEPTA